MNYHDAIRFFSGALVVYAVTAACSAISSPSPVGSAHAAPAALEESVEACDKLWNLDTTTHFSYAEHAYPGATAAELASSVFVLATLPPITLGASGLYTYGPPGFEMFAAGVWVRDGAVAAGCGETNKPTTATTVRFLRRPG